jgi:hypothetical protein
MFLFVFYIVLLELILYLREILNSLNIVLAFWVVYSLRGPIDFINGGRPYKRPHAPRATGTAGGGTAAPTNARMGVTPALRVPQRTERRWWRRADPSECRQRGGNRSSVGRHGRSI